MRARAPGRNEGSKRHWTNRQIDRRASKEGKNLKPKSRELMLLSFEAIRRERGGGVIALEYSFLPVPDGKYNKEKCHDRRFVKGELVGLN